MNFFVVVVASSLLIGASCRSSRDGGGKVAADRAANTLIDLYVGLRNFLFPKSPLKTNSVTSNRFVLLSPGKVLNYENYYPGFDYEDSLLEGNDSAPEPVVPPATMEKWFDIADVMVGADPLTGGVTAKSLARSYETVLSQMKLLGLETKSAEARAKYKKAHDYLMSSIPDPENMTQNTTRLSLYDRYHDEYTQKKLDMEEKINNARESRSSLDYELWFQRIYPSMNSKVEGAYMKWLTFGEKDLIELYKAYLDSGSSGMEVEEARIALRSSGVKSLDRTRTVYPVSFEPQNWYNYLKTEKRVPSYDMLKTKMTLLQSEINTLENINNTYSKQSKNSQAIIEMALKKESNISAETENKTSVATKLMIDCIVQSLNSSNNTSCNKFGQTKEGMISAMLQEAEAMSDYDRAMFFLNSSKFNNFLEGRIRELQQQMQLIKSQMNNTMPYLGDLVELESFPNLNEQSSGDPWTTFEYSSDQMHSDYSEEKGYLSVKISGLVLDEDGSVEGSGNLSLLIEDIKQAFNSANLKVSAEVLRVVIKRPWFRVELFQDPSLYFVQRDESQQKNVYVSPGPDTEKKLQDAISGLGEQLYILPEYVTSFVLSKNIKLEFSGVKSKSVGQMLQFLVTAKGCIVYEPYNICPSVGVGANKQSMTVHRTVNGMIINIPGSQIIGYYTEVLPRSPMTQK